MNIPFGRKNPSGSSSNENFNNSSICREKVSGNAWNMVCSTILLRGGGEGWHLPLSMGFVILGCKEFLFQSSALGFIKGVNRVKAPPPPHLIKTMRTMIEAPKNSNTRNNQTKQQSLPEQRTTFGILCLITTKQEPVFWCT